MISFIFVKIYFGNKVKYGLKKNQIRMKKRGIYYILSES